MSSKINISDIFKDHLSTLRDEASGRISAIDMGTFFGLSLAAGILSAFVGFKLSENTISIMISAFSIFAGLLINVLVLIYTAYQRFDSKSKFEDTSAVKLEKGFLKEIFSNLSFAIRVSVLAVVILIAAIFLDGGYKTAMTSVVVFLTTNFILTLLMSMKRLHILLSKRFE